MQSLIRGAENLIDDRQRLGQRTGATYRRPNSPWRFVGHTMEAPENDPSTPNLDEGWELDQLRNYILTFPYPPHLWASPENDWVGQTVPLTLAAYALKHSASDPETNHMHAIQLELIGYARDDPYTEYAEWIGDRVLGPILDAGVPINVGMWAPSTGSDGYGEDGAVRMSWNEWGNFNGICGHANVPGNSHWDPGRASYRRMAMAATGLTPPPPPAPIPDTENDTMMILERNDTTGQAAWLIGGGPPRKLTNPERTAYRTMKDEKGNDLVPKVGRNAEEMMLIIASELKRFDMELDEVD